MKSKKLYITPVIETIAFDSVYLTAGSRDHGHWHGHEHWHGSNSFDSSEEAAEFPWLEE